MDYYLILYSFIGFILLYFFSKISYKLNFVDIPNKRSMHDKPVAYTGGITLSIIYVISIKLFNYPTTLDLIISVAFLVSIIGFIDDKMHLNVGGKLSLQVIAVMCLISLENISLTSIGNYQYFEISLGKFAIPFTLVCIILLINSFNYFDGLDGTLSWLTISVVIILMFLIDNKNINLFLIIILIPLLIFLCFNFSFFNLPKLFLGDGGSLMLGFVMSFFLVYIAHIKLVHPILLAWSIIIFVYEFLSINFIRTKDKKNILHPGRDHLHHLLFKKTKSIFLTNFIICLTNICFFIMGYISFYLLSPTISLILLILMFYIFYNFRIKMM